MKLNLPKGSSELYRRKYVEVYGRDEQFPVTPTITSFYCDGERRYRFPKQVNGVLRKRSENGHALKMDGDIVILSNRISILYFKGQWHPVPSVHAISGWVTDSVVPTPEGDDVEPDAPDSWMYLLRLI